MPFLALAASGLPVSFDMPHDGKATVVIDDASGRRVRNLVNGIPFKKGRHTVEWDGRAEDGSGAEPGECRVRVVTHPGLSYDYRGPFAAGGEKMFQGFGPSHTACTMSMARGDRVVIASIFTEGGYSTLILDLDGRLVRGYSDGWNLGNKACVYLPGTGPYFYTLREKDGNELQFMSYAWNENLRPNVRLVDAPKTELQGAAQIGDKVFVANGLDKTLDVYSLVEDPRRITLSFTGERRPCPQPGPLTVVDGEIVTAMSPEQISIAADRALMYAIEEGSSVIHVYDRKTGKQVRTIGEDGGGYTGPWRKDRLVKPTSCALDSKGYLWVTEKRFDPKRITKWDVKKGTCVYEKTGSERYGAPGSGMDEDDPTHWMAHDAEWKYDPASGFDGPVACLHDETLPRGEKFERPPQVARTYRWVRRDGKTFVIGEDIATMVWEYLSAERRLRPVAMFCTPARYIHTLRIKEPGRTVEAIRDAYLKAFPPDGKKIKEDEFSRDSTTLMVWRDRNGNERFDADEFEFGPRLAGGTGYWGIFATDLDVRCGAFVDGEFSTMELKYPEWSVSKAWAARLRDKGRLPNGVGAFRNAEQVSAPKGWLVYTGTTPYMLGFNPGGQLAWYMKNPHVNVHGSHNAGLPKPGELQGVLFSVGSVPCGRKGEKDVMAVKNNHGRVFFITTDGIYLDELFTDCRVAAANDETYIGGESFGGSFQYDRKNRRAVFVSGGGGYRWYEIKGLDSVAETSYKRTFSARELVEAQEKFPVEAEGGRQKAVLSVPEAERGTRRVAQWSSGALQVRLDAGFSKDRLNLRYEVVDPSPWVNNGSDRYEMFKTGDCVDFQFLRGKSPVRVMVYPKGDGAEAVVYDFDGALAALRGESAAPHDFASPWRKVTAKHVFFPTDLDCRVSREDELYRVTFSVPLAWIAGTGRPVKVEADFGAIFGDRDGTINQSRVYWSNKATGLVNDVPGEIMPEPKAWGSVSFGAGTDGLAAETPRAAPKQITLSDAGTLVNPHSLIAKPYHPGFNLNGSYGPGPVFDQRTKTLYASGGRGRIVAMTRKGEPVAEYVLPGAKPFDRFDTMAITEKGELFVLASGDVFRVRPGAKDAPAAKVASGVRQIAHHVRDGKIMCLMDDSSVSAMSVADCSLSPWAEAVEDAARYPCMLDWLPTGELFACYRHNTFYKYKNGKAVRQPDLFGSREISLTRGEVIGDELWVLSGTTIKRFDARTLKPSPGVVYGGASGYFIGRVKTNFEMNAMGMCQVGDGLYAVHTPHNGAVYIMRYDPAKWELREVRRIGGIMEPSELLIDDAGSLLVDSLLWKFDAKPLSPPDEVFTRMPRRAAAVLPNGNTALVTETHGSKLEFRCGELSSGTLAIDYRNDVKPYPEGSGTQQKWGLSRPLSTFLADVGNPRLRALCALLPDGTVKKYTVNLQGHPFGDAWFAETRLTAPGGVEGPFESAASLPDGKLLVAVGGKLCVYESDGAGGWKNGRASAKAGASAIASDGNVVVVADAAKGAVSVLGYDAGRFRTLATKDGFAEPAKVAVRDGKIAVWERGTQSVRRLVFK